MGRNGRRCAAAMLAVLTLAACGGGGGSGDAAKVKQTVQRALAAVANGDGATACALSTPAGQARLRSALPGASCQQVIRTVAQHLPSQVKQGLRSAQIMRVTINGNRATVKDSDIHAAQGSLGGFLQTGSTALAKQPDGSWKLSG